jgi:nucleoside-diphosphate-sugar epimerase
MGSLPFQRVAVTGGNGALGRFVVDDLSRDASVTSLDLLPGRQGVRSRYVDVMNLPGLRRALEGHDAVVHLAALLTADHSEERILSINVQGTWNVLSAVADLGIQKVVLLSSECATGIINISRMELAKPEYLPIDEDHPLRPYDAYGVSKQLAEEIGRCFARRSHAQVVALRPTLIVMPGMEEHVRRVHDSEDPDLWSYVEVADVVQGIRRALELRDGREFEVFFLSATDTYAAEPTLKFMARTFGGLPPIRKPELYERNPFAAIWDLARAQSVLGFVPGSNWRRFIGRVEEMGVAQ